MQTFKQNYLIQTFKRNCFCGKHTLKQLLWQANIQTSYIWQVNIQTELPLWHSNRIILVIGNQANRTAIVTSKCSNRTLVCDINEFKWNSSSYKQTSIHRTTFVTGKHLSRSDFDWHSHQNLLRQTFKHNCFCSRQTLKQDHFCDRKLNI